MNIVSHPALRLSAALLLALTGSAALHAADTASAADKAFVAKVSQGGMYEVEASKLAEDKAYAQDVKDLASMEYHDHKLVGAKLINITTSLGIHVDSSLNPQFQKRLDTLKGLSGAAFDQAYLSEMIKVHDIDGGLFAQEAKTGGSSALKAFAAETVKIVDRHIGALHPKPRS
jgi:putative membrane protein